MRNFQRETAKKGNFKKKANRGGSKPTTPLNRIRGAIGEKTNWTILQTALESAKNDGASSHYEALYALSAISPLLNIAVPSSKIIKSPWRIQTVPALEAANLRKEVAWVATILSRLTQPLSRYIDLRADFARAVLSGSNEQALDLLTKIDDECGLSLWVVENRIAVLTAQGGFEQQKTYINKLLQSSGKNFTSFFAASIGERNEARITKNSYEMRLRERAKTWKIKSNQLNYILYKLIGFKALSPSVAADILAHEVSSSYIDLYETFIDILANCRQHLGSDSKKVGTLIEELKAVRDCRLGNLRIAYGIDEAPPPTTDEAIDQLLQGGYAEAFSLASERINTSADDFAAFLVLSRLVSLNFPSINVASPFLSKVLKLYGEFLEHGNQSDAAVQGLERIAINHRFLAISGFVVDLLESSSNDFFGAIPVTSAIQSVELPAPLLIALIDDDQRKSVVNAHQSSRFSSWAYQRAAQLGETHPGSLSREATAYARLAFSVLNDKYADGLVALTELERSEHRQFTQEATVLKAWLLLEDGAIFDSLLHTVRAAIRKPNLLRSLPLKPLLENRGFRDLKQMEKELCLSIGFYFYISLERENSKDVSLKVAWKQFHKAHRVKTPSELLSIKERFETAELVFFLRNVCNQEIMELSSAFSSPSDLDRERLKICIQLSKIDPDRTEDYDSEIIELTRRLSIEDGVQQVESSRVYVDVLGLQRWCHQNLNELFLRYMDYAGAGLQSSAEAIERTVRLILRKTGLEAEVLTFLDGYDVSADSLLAELIESCASVFMTLPRFGLDAFLGSRVRHGSFEGGFRSPLESRRLITKIDSSTNQYETNTYWLESGVFADDSTREALGRLLNTFSRNIDGLLDEAISRFVYVRTAENADGLISMWPADEEKKRQLLKFWLINAKVTLNKDATIEQFVEHCCTTFYWPALKASLAGASEFVTKTLAGRLTEELDVLARSAQNLPSLPTGLLVNIAVAKTDVENAATKIAKWFNPPQFTKVGGSYKLKTSIEIGITSLRHLRPEFNTRVEWSVDDRANVLLDPNAFQTINDVSYLIFGNIFKHSGYFDAYAGREDAPPIEISLRWKDPCFIEVEVLSAISANKDLNIIRLNIASAKERIASRQYESVVQQRNKTGFVRLASALNHEESPEKGLDFEVVDGNKFKVWFWVPEYSLTSGARA